FSSAMGGTYRLLLRPDRKSSSSCPVATNVNVSVSICEISGCRNWTAEKYVEEQAQASPQNLGLCCFSNYFTAAISDTRIVFVLLSRSPFTLTCWPSNFFAFSWSSSW